MRDWYWSFQPQQLTPGNVTDSHNTLRTFEDDIAGHEKAVVERENSMSFCARTKLGETLRRTSSESAVPGASPANVHRILEEGRSRAAIIEDAKHLHNS